MKRLLLIFLLFLSLFYTLRSFLRSHPDGEGLAHLLPYDFLSAVRALPVVSRQGAPEPQQVPADTNRIAGQLKLEHQKQEFGPGNSPGSASNLERFQWVS